MTEITKLNCQRTGCVNQLKLHNNPIRFAQFDICTTVLHFAKEISF